MIKFKAFSLIIFALLIVGCNKQYDGNRKSALLMYAATNNNLDVNIKDNINTILANFVPSEDKDIYIFFKGRYGNDVIPKLSKIVRNENGVGGKLMTVKSYSKDLICSSATTLNLILSDLSALHEITIIEDIILSSHGGSWLPYKNTPAIVRGFGDEQDAQKEVIEIDQMAKVMEQYNLNSIIFDVCFMNSIEVLYQLRNSAKYILASPAEVLAVGIDYAFATKYFTQKITKDVLIAIADGTNEFYKNSPEVELFYHSNALTVTECAYLEEFGNVAKNIAKYDKSKVNFELSTKIIYDNDGKFASDYKEYLYKLIDMYGNSSDRISLDAIWSKTFVHYCHTDILLGKYTLKDSHGVAGYIYKEQKVDKSINDYYKTLDWSKLINAVSKP